MFRLVRWSPLVLLLALVACGQDGGGGGAAPQITSFTANPVTTAAPGDAAQLSWVISGTTTGLVIDNGVGTVAGNNVTVNPTTTTTYKLTASNSSGSDEATTTVTVGGGSTGAPTGSFGVSASSSGPFQNDAEGGIVDASDARILRVQPNSTIYFQATYSDPDGIASVVPYLGNDNVDTDLTPGTSVYGFTASAPTGCTLGASQTSVTCLFTVQVGNIPNISDIAEFAGEFAYVFKVNVTDGAGTAAADSTRGYVIVGSGSDPTDPTTTDPTDPTTTDPTDPTTPTTYTLSVTKAGTGSGTVTGSGIDCGSDCSESYAPGTSLTLGSDGASGSTFVGWSGACSGTGNTCQVTMDAAKTVTATFNANPIPSDDLEVSINGAESRSAVVNSATALQTTVTNAGATATYAWTQVSGPAGGAVFLNPGEQSTNVTFSAVGTYVLQIAVTSGGESDTDTVTFNVTAATDNKAPEVNIGGDVSQTAVVNVPKALTSVGTDPDGDTLTYQWNVAFGSANNVKFGSATSANTSVAFSASGSYSIRVTVTDPEGKTDTDDVEVDVTSN